MLVLNAQGLTPLQLTDQGSRLSTLLEKAQQGSAILQASRQDEVEGP